MQDYSLQEERINVWSHALGIVLSILGFILLMAKSIPSGDVKAIISVAIFGLSMIFVYTASTLYHNEKKVSRRSKLKILDHAAIYVLIAGSYTPFTLITLNSPKGWWIFSISWTMAFIGIILKLFFTGRFTIVSTLMYVLMGWMIVFAIKPLMASLSTEGMNWLVAGGVAYTVGAVLYAIKKIKFNHAIFHIFVLAGTFCHFISVYYYVL